MTPFETVTTILRGQAKAGVLPAHIETMPLSPQTVLGELGMDSLGKMSLLTELMDATDNFFSEDDFDDKDTLGAIAQKILGDG